MLLSKTLAPIVVHFNLVLLLVQQGWAEELTQNKQGESFYPSFDVQELRKEFFML